jgi:acyl-CoA reductase-like NAD-dependent aldehyde dehydrogenase
MSTDQLVVMDLPGVVDRPQVFIGGTWTESTGDEWIEVIDPWTEDVAARVRAATVDDVAAAVRAARESFESGVWSSRAMAERADVLDRIADRMAGKHAQFVSASIVEVGLPASVAAPTEKSAFANIRTLAAVARGYATREDRRRAGGGISRILKEPVGVVAAVLPWNGPVGMLAFKVLPAVVAGCSVVIKCAPEAPLSVAIFADTIAELTAEGALPAGVVSIVTADRGTSESLVANPEVDHVTFTGSTAAGRRIMEVASSRVASVGLELGGKSAAIILDDADLGHVMTSLPMAGCMQSGQACIALTRVLISEKRHDEFIEAFTEAVKRLTVGADPLSKATVLGPLAMERQRDRIERYIATARDEGATIVLGGGRPEGIDRGFFLEPTIIDRVTNDMTIAQEELFGPVIAVITYTDEQDAIRIANDSIYGLSGAVYTQDLEHGFEVAQKIKAGTLSVNAEIIDFTMPFGGYKQSGIGREGVCAEGIEEYLEIKTVHMP